MFLANRVLSLIAFKLARMSFEYKWLMCSLKHRSGVHLGKCRDVSSEHLIVLSLNYDQAMVICSSVILFIISCFKDKVPCFLVKCLNVISILGWLVDQFRLSYFHILGQHPPDAGKLLEVDDILGYWVLWDIKKLVLVSRKLLQGESQCMLVWALFEGALTFHGLCLKLLFRIFVKIYHLVGPMARPLFAKEAMKQKGVQFYLSQGVFSDILNNLFFGIQTNDKLFIAFD